MRQKNLPKELLRHQLDDWGDKGEKLPKDLGEFPYKKSTSRRNYRRAWVSGNAMDRFLNANVGRTWDDVYSKLCEKYDKRDENNYNFFDSLKWHVTIDTYMLNGEVVTNDSMSGVISVEKSRDDSFYVHPETRILVKVNGYKKAQNKAWRKECGEIQETHVKAMGKLRWAFKDQKTGIWYEVKAKYPDPPTIHKRLNYKGVMEEFKEYNRSDEIHVDLYASSKSSSHGITLVLPGYVAPMYLYFKRQLSHAEKKRLKII